MNAHIITIGDELLIGQVVDTNSAWLGEKLAELGVLVDKIISIHDDQSEIIKQLEISCRETDLVILSGGLGPTRDDITKTSLAAFLGVPMVFNQDAYDGIVRYLARHGREPVDAIRAHSYFPEGTVFLRNDMGTAPGMVFQRDRCTLISVPGVPYEMKFIMEQEGFELIRALNKDNRVIITNTILTAGEFEARLSDRLKDITDQLPDHISIAFLPNLNQVRLRLTAKGNDRKSLQEEVNNYSSMIEERLGIQVFGHGKENLALAVGKLMLERGLDFSTADSCTGGYLAHLVTSNAGSSAYYKGSVIAYSNELKAKILGVPDEILSHFGAVSEQTVREMVKGCLKSCGTDLAVAVSGIAGPDGGTEEKPVGLVWLAAGNREKVVSKKIQMSKDRIKHIQASAIHALDLLRIFVLENYPS